MASPMNLRNLQLSHNHGLVLISMAFEQSQCYFSCRQTDQLPRNLAALVLSLLLLLTLISSIKYDHHCC